MVSWSDVDFFFRRMSRSWGSCRNGPLTLSATPGRPHQARFGTDVKVLFTDLII